LVKLSFIVVVAHDKFKKMKLENMKKFMKDKGVLIDVRGIFDGEEANRDFIIGHSESNSESCQS
jgi:UDP-N-acetyl-D-mannosaminuronate dehydrogenase